MAEQSQRRSSLVEGGVRRCTRADLPQIETILSRTIPTIHENTIIVAAASPSFDSASQNEDGWFLSDFYALNYLLKGATTDQTWLTAVDPERLLLNTQQHTSSDEEEEPYAQKKKGKEPEKKKFRKKSWKKKRSRRPKNNVPYFIGCPIEDEESENEDDEQFKREERTYLHGTPNRERKVVLSSDLLRSEISPVTVVEPARMIRRFIKQVKNASLRAKSADCPLLLLVFCHGNDKGELLLNDETKDIKKHLGLTVRQLKSVLQPGVAVTLLTSACSSGVWATTDRLNTWTMSAAPRGNYSLSIPLSSSHPRRACGSIFVAAAIEAIADASAHILEQDCSPSPDEPADSLTKTYNELCRTIVDTAIKPHLYTPIDHTQKSKHRFQFSARYDEWEASWTARSGIPLARFKERWAKLPTYPSTTSDEDMVTAGHLTGSAAECIDEMTEIIAHQRVYDMARLFRNLCPGDWRGGQDVAVYGILSDFLDKGRRARSSLQIANMILFRWDTCLRMDKFIEDERLQRPNDQICIMWDRDRYDVEMRRKFGSKEWYQRYDTAYSDILRPDMAEEMEGQPVRYASITPGGHQGRPFQRPLFYIASAIAESVLTEDRRSEVLQAYWDLVVKTTEFNRNCDKPSLEADNGFDNWLKLVSERIRNKLKHSKSSVSKDEKDAPSSSKKRGKATAPSRPRDQKQDEKPWIKRSDSSSSSMSEPTAEVPANKGNTDAPSSSKSRGKAPLLPQSQS
ncbi:hypothetical protein B0T17DRAFT_641271 [Bombardia bombarda]|uniref:Uncharacterized protein n=1 Tax=Bombardia bombarda TaxID=252184 RepID=A0AA39WTQ2_9PEZI|nr:hypothetical protein B0T17DRAFT_641271 [Bombardia bombarda]